MDWYDKARASERLAIGMQKHGWIVVGYSPTESDPMIDYFRMGFWSGTATKAEFPDVVVECMNGKVPKGKMIAVYVKGKLVNSFTGFTELSSPKPNTDSYIAKIESAIKGTGKTVVTLKTPEAPATSKQLWYLHILTKTDTRGLSMSMEEASNAIASIRKGVAVDLNVYKKE